MKLSWKLFCCVLAFVPAKCYVFDTENAVVYENPKKTDNARPSYFGYSVILISKGKDMKSTGYLYIGAPRARSRKGVTESGTVYGCDFNVPCWEIDFSDEGQKENHRTPNGWMGGSMSILHEENNLRFPVCGWRWAGPNFTTKIPHHLIGICYRVKLRPSDRRDTGTFCDLRAGESHLSEISVGNGSYHLEAGFSVHVIPSKTSAFRFITGNPADESNSYSLAKCSNEKCISSSISPVGGGKSFDNNSYFGYSINSGYYFSAEPYLYALGGPRSNDLRGGVILVTEETKTRASLSGEQLGEYFGSSLASCDVNGDNITELVVGSPFWSVGPLDVGRISVYEDKKGKLELLYAIEGHARGGQFGSVVTCLGDVDGDGLQDLAVGAPYEGDGVVYVYSGMKTRRPENESWSQRILPPKGIKGFGISISNPVDMDNNGFVDVAVGAHLSDAVVFLRSKTVVALNISFEDRIVVTDKGPSGRTKHLTSKICAKCRVMRSDSRNCSDIRITYTADVPGGFATFSNDSDDLGCQKFNVTVNKAASVISCRVRASVSREGVIRRIFKAGAIYNNDINFGEASVVVNPRSSKVEDSIKFPALYDCEDNETRCDPRLKFQLSTNLGESDKFVYGSKLPIKLIARVVNEGGGDAFDVFVDIVSPAPFIDGNTNSSYCHRCDTGNEYCLRCLVDRILPMNTSATIYVEINTTSVDSQKFKIKTNVTASNGTNARISPSTYPLSIDVDTVFSLTIDGRASSVLTFTDDNIDLIPFEHSYGIASVQRATFRRASLLVSVPTHFDGRHVIELKNPAGCNVTDRLRMTDGGSLGNNSTGLIRCGDPRVECSLVNCALNSFERDVVKYVKLSLRLDHKKLPANTMDWPMIRYETTATASVNGPPGYDPTDDLNKPFAIRRKELKTKFLRLKKSNNEIAPWIIPVSVVVGMLLLALVAFVLYKCNFFKRSKKKELEMLQNDSNRTYSIVLHTASSKEALEVD